ncbi:MAG: hypothetical protein ACKO3W_07675, partial [bacterium]
MSIVSPELEKALGSLKGSRIGRILRKFSAAGQFGKFNQITPEIIEELVAFQQTPEGKGRLLGQLLKEKGLIDETGIQKALAAQKGFALVDLEGFEPSPEAVKSLDRRMPRQFMFMPLEFDASAKAITVAVFDPNNIYVTENLKQVGNMRRVSVVVAEEAQVKAMLDRHYPPDQARTVDLSLDVDKGFSDDRFKGRGSSLDDDT